ncbi:MAG: hypothetical protein U0235_31115 [Polyangiaceae bacterium]
MVVRPSSREPYFTRALVHELGDARVRIDETLDVASLDRGEIHLYGRDETIAEVRARARVPVRGHGTGMGVAIVRGRELERGRGGRARRGAVRSARVPEPARGLGRGRDRPRERVRSRARGGPRIVARPRPARLAHPRRGAEAARYLGTLAFAGELFAGPDSAVGVADELTVPPVGRHVHVVPFARDDDAAAVLAPVARFVAAVGHDAPLSGLASLTARARRSALGDMQRPRLDGPVDLRDVVDS